MFRPRNPLPVHKRVSGFLWPRGGWRRSGIYVSHRLRRLPGTPYRIAAGFACGAAISFTPFIGLHFVLSAALALIVRGNIIESAISTVVGNTWTLAWKSVGVGKRVDERVELDGRRCIKKKKKKNAKQINKNR